MCQLSELNIEDDNLSSKRSLDNLIASQKSIALAKYLDFANVFSKKLAKMLLEQIRINNHAIKLEKNKQQLYKLIYSLDLVELKTLKTYTKTNLANDFIWPSKLSASTLILFFHKSNRSLRLCVYYSGLNKLQIKYRYLFPLIGKSLD